jgi:hypothetical protein
MKAGPIFANPHADRKMVRFLPAVKKENAQFLFQQLHLLARAR